MKEPNFIHLHIHSDYSMIDGLAKIHSLVEQAAYLNMPALAITDFTNIFGSIKFYSYAHNLGIKPIIGSDFLIKFHNKYFEVTCLAANNTGYKNLINIISKAYRNRSYTQTIIPTITYSLLSEHNEGLILLSGGYKGDIGQYLIYHNTSQIEQCILFYMKYFHDRYYFEITRTGQTNETIYLNKIITIAIQKKIPLVATNNVRFIHAKDFKAHQIRVAIHKGTTYENIKKSQTYTPQQFMRNEQDMCKLFFDIPAALTNTVEIAKRCNLTMKFNQFFLPKFPTGKTPITTFLIKHAKNGLEERLKKLFPNPADRYIQRKNYDNRLNNELQMINNMGFPGYFLIVMEFIQWAKKNCIPVGPGRGSGASSLVAYALKITDLNPLQFNLLFERFLNPERISMPDLDIDFCMEKRDMVIDHVIKTYGNNAVSQIITFATMSARAVIKDVGRVLEYPYIFVDKISKLIPLEPRITLKKAFNTSQKLCSSYHENEDIKSLIDMAFQLEGVIKNVGKHAGGIVIAPTTITDFAPLYYDKGGKYPMTQFDKDDIERIGLIKFDFLGLRTLTIIDSTLKIINQRSLKNNLSLIDINTIPLNDKKSFKILQTGETTAIFQLESKGIKELIKRLQPDCFEDIIALIALFRPGPLQSGMVDNFINRKHGREKIFYPDSQWQHDSLKPVLESTYGIILYQEQVMQIAQVLAGYSLADADVLRRAIGKKQPKEMAKQRSIFQAGAHKLGIDNTLSMKIFDLVEKFSGYGFNKSHSAAYALLSYQTLWLKTHHPAEFMASTLNADIDNIDKIIKLIRECQRMMIKILPPNINTSQYHFHVNDNHEIIYGMGAIKGLGEHTIQSIITIRNNYGIFKNLFDLCTFSQEKNLNKKIIEKLIFSGTCDCFGTSRTQLIQSLDYTIKTANQYINNKINHQHDMFEILITEPNTSNKSKPSKYSEETLLHKEREIIGMYLSNHPINKYLKEIHNYKKIFPSIKKINEIVYISNNKTVSIVGLLISKKIINTKNNNQIALCTIDDNTGELEIIIRSTLLNKLKNYINHKSILLIQGKVNIDNTYNRFRITANTITNINNTRK
ncbi:DNA polymerase III subunit alpha [Blochmannia endosymbiont of Polyrhachis (Hedomyrma) turneri]